MRPKKLPHENKNNSPPPTRCWELDLLRGLTLILMMIYHFCFDLIQICGAPLILPQSIWRIGPDLIGGSFLVISGLASTQTTQSHTKHRSDLRRGGLVLSIGVLLTLATIAFTPKYVILFGILHCIGLSIILGSLLKSFTPRILTLIALATLILGYQAGLANPSASSIKWLETHLLNQRQMIDYFPLIPFFGYYLVGIALGKSMWPKIVGHVQNAPRYRYLIWMGQHSLWVYLLHQLILFPIAYLISLYV